VPIKIFAYQHGIYPRSEDVVKATRSLDRGRTDQTAVDAAFREDLARWIQVQREAGLDFFSDGLLRWQDIFRPLVEGLGLKPHTLVRWFDTNTFFREPEFSSFPSPSRDSNFPSPSGGGQGGGPIPDPSVPRPRVATLPSPYMFSRAAKTTGSRNQLMLDLATTVLKPMMAAAVAAGAELIHLEEPWLAYEGIAASDWSPLGEALDVLHRGLAATLVLHLYFGDAAPHLARLSALPVDAIGIDLIETDINALGTGWEKGLVAGIINGRDSRMEATDALVDAVRHLADRVHPPNLYLSSNCELAFLPTVVAEQKVERLGQVARQVKELVSV
jgi:5-methyltetrahydropteroyltriglutamate--homocysteine methyltransferase